MLTEGMTAADPARTSRPLQAPGDAGGWRTFLTILIPVAVIIAGILALLSYREVGRAEESEISMLREASKAIFDQIVVARLWNASHGGIYAEVSAETLPNPYLPSVDRVITAGGKQYTKINPAYMSRQMSTLSLQRNGVTFRIIGPMPLNPLNSPDVWETQVLQDVVRGAGTAMDGTFEEHGVQVFRAVFPLRIERPCLACHEQQGYRLGDVKGAISVRVPRPRYDAVRDAHRRGSIVAFLVIGAAGFLVTAGVVWLLSRKLAEAARRSICEHKLAASMELAGAVAHEMRQPMTVVHCRLSLLEEKAARGEPLSSEDVEIIKGQCVRMNDCIENLLQLTEYRTREYVDGVRIMDIGASRSIPGRISP